MSRIINQIKKPRKSKTSQADKKVLISNNTSKITKKLDISEFQSLRYMIFGKKKYEISNFCPKKSHILNFKVEKFDISNFDQKSVISELISYSVFLHQLLLIVCSGRVRSLGGVQRCVKLVM